MCFHGVVAWKRPSRKRPSHRDILWEAETLNSNRAKQDGSRKGTQPDLAAGPRAAAVITDLQFAHDVTPAPVRWA